MIPEERLLEDMRETMYYGFCSTELIYEFSVELTKLIKETIDEIEENLLESITPDSRGIVNKVITELRSLYKINTQTALEKFCKATYEIFAIPQNAKISRLDKDEEFRAVSDNELQALEKEVAELKSNFHEERYFVEILREKKAKYDAIKPLQNKIAKMIEMKRKSPKKSAMQVLEVLQKYYEFYNKNKESLEEVTLKADMFELFDD